MGLGGGGVVVAGGGGGGPPRRHIHVEFLRALGSQSGVSVWQHTLVS